MELDTLQKLAAATETPRWQKVKHTTRYLRIAMPQLHDALCSMGLSIPTPRPINLVADNATYEVLNQIYTEATGTPFAPITDEKVAAKPTAKLQPNPLPRPTLPTASAPNAAPLAAVAVANAPRGLNLSLAQITELHAEIFGKDSTKARIENRPGRNWAGSTELPGHAEARANIKAELRTRWTPEAADKLTALIQAQNHERRGSDDQVRERLLSDFTAAGLEIPGLVSTTKSVPQNHVFLLKQSRITKFLSQIQ